MHSMQLAEHGGSDGIRDESLLDSALAKPRNVFAYADPPTLPARSLVRLWNRPKSRLYRRQQAHSAGRVRSLSGLETAQYRLIAGRKCYLTFLHLAEGTLSEDDLAAWFTAHAVPL